MRAILKLNWSKKFLTAELVTKKNFCAYILKHLGQEVLNDYLWDQKWGRNALFLGCKLDQSWTHRIFNPFSLHIYYSFIYYLNLYWVLLWFFDGNLAFFFFLDIFYEKCNCLILDIKFEINIVVNMEIKQEFMCTKLRLCH